MRRRLRTVIGPILAVASLLVLVTVSSAPVGAVAAVVPESDIRVRGEVEEAPPGGGITTSDEMRYRITIENAGPGTVPANAISLVAFVGKDNSPDLAVIEISRFNGQLIPEPGGECGVGRRAIVRCTNRREIQAGNDLTLVFANRHPAAEAGQLSFFVEVTPRNAAYVDNNAGNNSFRGPSYSFQDQPVTTTTLPTTTTTLATTTSSMPDSSSTSDPNASSTSVDPSSTTVASSTTTTLPTTTTTLATTTLATTTTVQATTATTLAPTTSIEALVDQDAALPDQSSSSVLGATGEADPLDPALQDVAAPVAQTSDDGGLPLLLIGAILAVLLLMGGVGLALYSYLNRPPPLVDIRQYR